MGRVGPIPPIQLGSNAKPTELINAMNQTIIAMNQRLADLGAPTSGGGSVDDAPTVRIINGALNDLPIGRGSYLEITMAENIVLTGMAGGVDGRPFVLKVKGTGIMTLSHQSTSSASGNRLWTRDGNGTTLNASVNGAAYFVYSQRLQSWIVIIGVL